MSNNYKLNYKYDRFYIDKFDKDHAHHKLKINYKINMSDRDIKFRTINYIKQEGVICGYQKMILNGYLIV